MSKNIMFNERIKHKYRVFLKEAKQYSEASLDTVDKAISRFDHYNGYRDFRRFHVQQAIGFKKHLLNQVNPKTGKPLSKATINSTLRHLKSFFEWLSREPGFKSSVNYSDAEYFSLSEKDTRIATTKRNRPVPTLDQIRIVLEIMPATNEVELRNRALIAFTVATGARDRAIASLKLKHVDLAIGCVHQDAREVQTKFSKTFDTYFFPVGEDITGIIKEWIEYLREKLLWSDADPLFPSTKMGLGSNRQLAVQGLKREHWKDAGPIRRIFKEAFESAGLPYFNPHSFRNTLAGLGEEICRSPEEFKAWSQNLGHEGVLTTLYSYGEVKQERQKEIINSLSASADVKSNSTEELIKEMHRMMLEKRTG